VSDDIHIQSDIVNCFIEAKSILVLTGAGISAESGIPTFRGEDGYWQVGSDNYFPEQMATQRFFSEMPEELWKWYRHRQEVCMNAQPNDGHRAISDLEIWSEKNSKDFLLVTQNVDNLHNRAGIHNIIEIHGNIFKYRCNSMFSQDGHSLSVFDYENIDSDDPLPKCKICNGLLRPHVLWFDEYYTEELFKAETAMKFALKTELLLVVGTALATNIPNRIVGVAYQSKIPIIEINPNPILSQYTGFIFDLSSSTILPHILESLP
jgi:NAD-dependent deacetylase